MSPDERRDLIGRLKDEGIRKEVIDAMLDVPREYFIPAELRDKAYDDIPLPIGHGQTISAPHMVAFANHHLELGKGHKVLEIGTGSGYNAAVMADIIGPDGQVYTLELIEDLARMARENIRKTGYDNIEVITSDGSMGYRDEAPYDRINVTCSAPEIPQSLIDQLKTGGKMIIPVGHYPQGLYLVEKKDAGRTSRTYLGNVMFVPLRGRYGFKDD